MKIITICGHGLGSSFMVESIIKQILTEEGLSAELSHMDISSVSTTTADIYLVGKDLADSVNVENLIVLNSLIDKTEIKEKLLAKIKEIN
ncbi:MAG: PTS sugar transporter subunit IIB [Alphaproteobacteria bacterium]|jgi:PTS system ascorbate-specific IIB component|nr:PTS sugar transporter subunit IIB [Alphaproteobacteria bacterium]